jgi:D-lactate dehydrogenase (cytochrome)
MVEDTPKLRTEDLDYLISAIGKENVSIRETDLDLHARDQSFHTPQRPAAVVWPASTQEVGTVLKYANQHHIPITPWGAGTSLEGNPIPLFGGIVLNMTRMDKILAVHPGDFQVDIQAGIFYLDMNAALARHGLFFAPDPGANATIGGMIANNAAGTRTVRYGTMKDNVMRLEVVLPSGEVMRMGSRALKTSSGYDLVHLFIGSEGTLGVVTEATLRLAPIPEKFSAAIASFPALGSATRAVSGIMGSGLIPAALEFIDSATLSKLNASGEFALPQQPTLLMEFHSATEGALKEELNLVENICREEGCLDFESGLGRSARDRLWRMRHNTYEILVRSNPGKAFLIMDVAVPISAYSSLVSIAERTLSDLGIEGYLVGHAGDGNLHPLVPYIPDDPETYAVASSVSQAIVEAAITMGGTATGEHGVGIGKRRFMALEHGASFEAMRSIKATFDPHGILNPGKLFEPDDV